MSWLVALKTLGRLAGAMIAVGGTERLSSRSSAMQWCSRWEVELREVEAAWGSAERCFGSCAPKGRFCSLQVRTRKKCGPRLLRLGCRKKFWRARGTYRFVAVVAEDEIALAESDKRESRRAAAMLGRQEPAASPEILTAAMRRALRSQSC